MSTDADIIDTPAACIKCGFTTNSPTTGKTQDKCPCCGGQLISVSKLTPGENVIILAKRASWDCSNDEGEWYGRKTTEEQIVKHFAPLGAELSALRAKLAEAEQEVERCQGIVRGYNEMIMNERKTHFTLQEQHKRAVELLREVASLLHSLTPMAEYPSDDWSDISKAKHELINKLRAYFAKQENA